MSGVPLNGMGQRRAHREFRGNGGVVDVAGDILNLRIVFSSLRGRRSARLQRRHGRELFGGGNSG
jgi:hypothetical protein